MKKFFLGFLFLMLLILGISINWKPDQGSNLFHNPLKVLASPSAEAKKTNISRMAATAELPLNRISFYENGQKLPVGKFQISIYALAPGARSMALSEKDTLFVGTGGLGGTYKRVYAILAHEGLAKPEQVKIILDDLDVPNGVALRNGDLFVAENSRILVYRNIEQNLDKPPTLEVFSDQFPDDRQHGWKYIRFDSKGLLYVAVGFPCNVCARDAEHGVIYRLSFDGKQKQLVATGVRNSVGFNFYPSSQEFFFTNNGRDMLGDDLPPETLNRIPSNAVKPTDFGFPYCHAGRIPDPAFAAGRTCSEFAKPAMELPAHVAPLGLHFYIGNMLPPGFKNQGFIAEHGSWNRSKPQGYRISLARTKDSGKTFSYEIFADGWLDQENPWGRPVDILEMKDGSLLVSDDFAGVIYRITYHR